MYFLKATTHLWLVSLSLINIKTYWTGRHINKCWMFRTWIRIRSSTVQSGDPHKKVIQVGHQLCSLHHAAGTSLYASFLLLLLLLLSWARAEGAALLQDISQQPPLLFPLLNNMCTPHKKTTTLTHTALCLFSYSLHSTPVFPDDNRERNTLQIRFPTEVFV